MSDDQRIPDPSANEESEPENPFANLEAIPIDMEFPGESAPSAPGDFAAPDYKATKTPWWKRWFQKPETAATAQKPNKPKKPMPVMSASALRTGLVDFYNGIAFMLMPVRPEIAMVVASQAEKCADAWIEYSKTNPAIKRFLIGLVTASAGGALIMAHVPIMVALAVEFVPGMKEKQENAMADFAARMSANIPTTEDGQK